MNHRLCSEKGEGGKKERRGERELYWALSRRWWSLFYTENRKASSGWNAEIQLCSIHLIIALFLCSLAYPVWLPGHHVHRAVPSTLLGGVLVTTGECQALSHQCKPPVWPPPPLLLPLELIAPPTCVFLGTLKYYPKISVITIFPHLLNILPSLRLSGEMCFRSFSWWLVIIRMVAPRELWFPLPAVWSVVPCSPILSELHHHFGLSVIPFLIFFFFNFYYWFERERGIDLLFHLVMHSLVGWFFLFIFIPHQRICLLIFRERGRCVWGREREMWERNSNQLPPSHMRPNRIESTT